MRTLNFRHTAVIRVIDEVMRDQDIFKHITRSLWEQMSRGLSELKRFAPKRAHWSDELIKKLGRPSVGVHPTDHAYELEIYVFTKDNLDHIGITELMDDYLIHKIAGAEGYWARRLAPAPSKLCEGPIESMVILEGQGGTPLMAIVDLCTKEKK